MKSYRDLKIWQLGIEISATIYRLTSSFPEHELYGLASQMQRASVSIPSNRAEGHPRGSAQDLLRSVAIAQGSLAELETQRSIARQLSYGNTIVLEQLDEMAGEESRMLSGYRRSLKSKL
jgi:four helix bundle protein